MKSGLLILLLLNLVACHKEPEKVENKKVITCAFNKQAEVCKTLNSTEEKALSCLTASGEFSKKECDEIKVNRGPDNLPDIKFNLRHAADNN
jgi:hypothetical protein